MSEQIISKRCPKCKTIKPISEFYKNRTMSDGLNGWCKSCCNLAIKFYQQSLKGKEVGRRAVLKYRQTKKGKKTRRHAKLKQRNNHPEKNNAQHAIYIAIRAGRLPRPDSLPCHYCPAQAKEYHHYKGYAPEHWLDVVPVCIPCHNKIPKNKVISATV